MSPIRQLSKLSLVLAIGLTGCAAKTVDMSKIHRPDRPAELDAYSNFVGSWTWTAEMMNADQAHRNWTGTAE
jgi:hypothetical protein